MGRKWTNVRFELSDRSEAVPKASSNPPTQQEELYNFLRERWDDENVSPVKEIDVMFGNPSTDKLTNWMEEVFQECDFIERAAAINVTDSAHIGYGLIFERTSTNNNNEIEIVEEYHGYEGAMGEDVEGMIYEEEGINVNANWYWD